MKIRVFKIYLFFNLKIIALQNFVDFCQTSNTSTMLLLLLLSRFSPAQLYATP